MAAALLRAGDPYIKITKTRIPPFHTHILTCRHCRLQPRVQLEGIGSTVLNWASAPSPRPPSWGTSTAPSLNRPLACTGQGRRSYLTP